MGDEAGSASSSGSGWVTGRVVELWRYPVKSMLGESVDALELGPMGVVGDRRFGLVDRVTGHLLSAKAVPELFTARARTMGEVVSITLPDGTALTSDDPATPAALSAWLGRPVELRESGPTDDGSSIEFELRFDPADDSGDLVPWPTMAGSFLDSAPVHVLTTGSLRAMAEARAESIWDVRRFRPNLLVDTGAAEGFIEDGWVGRGVALGSSGPTIRVDQAAMRCAMPLRPQASLGDRPALERDLGVFRALSAEHDNHLGAYCGVASPGTVSIGDQIREVGVG